MKISKSILRTLQKTKRSQIPKSPQNAKDILDAFKIASVRDQFGRTMRKDEKDRSDFFRGAVDGDGFSFCVFASEDIIKATEKVIPENKRKFFADGTFAVRYLLFLFDCMYVFTFKFVLNHLNDISNLMLLLYLSSYLFDSSKNSNRRRKFHLLVKK